MKQKHTILQKYIKMNTTHNNSNYCWVCGSQSKCISWAFETKSNSIKTQHTISHCPPEAYRTKKYMWAAIDDFLMEEKQQNKKIANVL